MTYSQVTQLQTNVREAEQLARVWRERLAAKRAQAATPALRPQVLQPRRRGLRLPAALR